MSLVSLAIDGFLQRNPAILRPIMTVPARTQNRGPYPGRSQGFPRPAVESGRRLVGSGNFDQIQDQRFARAPARLAAPGRAPIQTFMGLGGQNAVYVEPETLVKSFNAPADYGNLPPKVPVKTFEAAEKISRTPVKTF